MALTITFRPDKAKRAKRAKRTVWTGQEQCEACVGRYYIYSGWQDNKYIGKVIGVEKSNGVCTMKFRFAHVRRHCVDNTLEIDSNAICMILKAADIANMTEISEDDYKGAFNIIENAANALLQYINHTHSKNSRNGLE